MWFLMWHIIEPESLQYDEDTIRGALIVFFLGHVSSGLTWISLLVDLLLLCHSLYCNIIRDLCYPKNTH